MVLEQPQPMTMLLHIGQKLRTQVAKKSSYQQESTPTLAAARFSRAPFPRVFPPGAYRPQPLTKPGAKSLQWKRNTQPSTSQKVASLTRNKSLQWNRNTQPSGGMSTRKRLSTL